MSGERKDETEAPKNWAVFISKLDQPQHYYKLNYG